MYHVSAQGVDECTINVHYYYYRHILVAVQESHPDKVWSNSVGRHILVAMGMEVEQSHPHRAGNI